MDSTENSGKSQAPYNYCLLVKKLHFSIWFTSPWKREDAELKSYTTILKSSTLKKYILLYINITNDLGIIRRIKSSIDIDLNDKEIHEANSK